MSDLPSDPSQAWAQFQELAADRDLWKARCEAGAAAWDELVAKNTALKSELARVQAIADANASALTRAVLDLKQALDGFAAPECECWRDAE